MKRLILINILLSMITTTIAQQDANPVEGTISYVTSQNVYVRFKSTENISAGDTLFIMINSKLTAALRVNNLSSISCVCIPLIDKTFRISESVFTTDRSPNPEIPSAEDLIAEKIKESETTVPETADSLLKQLANNPALKQKITGRISVASYFNFSNTPYDNSLRLRYNLTINASNINNSRLSAETYISFSHRNKEWNEIQSNVFRGLKIYNLALKYEFGNKATIWVGRKINPKISNMGAVDGVQFEIKTASFTTGILAGSRPDYRDYSFNTSLFQYGVFVNHEGTDKKKAINTTIAFIEQKNTGSTDRRFTYIQHSNSLIKNLNLFGSAEFELYRYKVKPLADSIFLETEKSPKLSNLYLSARYRFNNRVSASFSYSARKNIFYYETYKNLIDRLIESETQQGYQLQTKYRPLKKLSLGASAGYRLRKGDGQSSKNLYAYATYSEIPFINVSATLSGTFMSTYYLNGNIYALNLARSIIQNKITLTVSYRFIDYNFTNSNFSQNQHTGEININWKVLKKLSCSFYYEGTFDKRSNYNRLFFQLSRRF